MFVQNLAFFEKGCVKEIHMAKALKPLIVVLLVLSIVSLVLGIMLFTKREMLKGRTQKHEQAIAGIAEKLRYENLNKEQLKVYEQMQSQLDPLVAFADNRYEELQNTKKDLELTRADLAKTQDELATTKTALAASEQQVAELTTTVEQKDAEIAQLKGRADQLEQDKANLQLQVDDLNSKLVKSEEDMRDLQDQVATLEKIVKEIDAQRTGAVGFIKPGLSGKILVVNPSWNFVILDIGSEAGLVPTAEMLVHRNDNLVGKVRISSVRKNMSIAEIMRDWEKAPIQEGDYVLF